MKERFAYRSDLPLSAVASIGEIASEQHWPDVIPMAGGEPRFKPPDAALEALHRSSLDELTKYAPFRGTTELISGIRRKLWEVNALDVPGDEVIAVPGGAQALFSILSVLIDHDRDEIILVDPCWEHYPRIVLAARGRVTFVRTSQQAAHNCIDYEMLISKLSSRTAAVVVNTPLNPTGSVLYSDELAELGEHCNRAGTRLVVDEEYETFVYDGLQHVSARTVVPNAISLFSVSKSFALTGIRLGYITADSDIIDAVKRFGIFTYMFNSSPAIQMASAVLSDDVRPYLARVTAEYQEKTRAFNDQLQLIDGVETVRPEGGLYLFPLISWEGDVSAAMQLIHEHHLLCVPGEVAGEQGRGRVRFFVGLPHQILADAATRIRRLLDHG